MFVCEKNDNTENIMRFIGVQGICFFFIIIILEEKKAKTNDSMLIKRRKEEKNAEIIVKSFKKRSYKTKTPINILIVL